MSVFDEHSQTYEDDIRSAVALARQDPDFFAELKARLLVELAEAQVGAPETLSVLDVGCGPGPSHDLLARRFGSLHAVDPSPAMIERAEREHPAVSYEVADGKTLPFPDGAFDVTFTVCVLHHVPPADWQPFVAELARVTRADGLVAIFEHNPLNPLTRLVVSRCAFDEDAVLLRRPRAETLVRGAGMRRGPGGYILFFPWRSRRARAVERRLAGLPLGAQYFVTGRP